jgi:hypothetical protein
LPARQKSHRTVRVLCDVPRQSFVNKYLIVCRVVSLCSFCFALRCWFALRCGIALRSVALLASLFFTLLRFGLPSLALLRCASRCFALLCSACFAVLCFALTLSHPIWSWILDWAVAGLICFQNSGPSQESIWYQPSSKAKVVVRIIRVYNKDVFTTKK